MKLLFASENQEDVRIYRPSADRRAEEKESDLLSCLGPGAREFVRKHGVLLAICAALLLISLTCTICVKISYNNGYSQAKADLAEEYEARYRQQVQSYIDQQASANFLSGEASKKAAIESDARLLARIGQGVLNTYSTADLDDARKVMLCAICRAYDSRNFPDVRSIEAAVTQPNQWWGYSESMAITEEILAIATEISTIYHEHGALPCSADMVYAGWNGSEIVLRNQWEANASARYY